MFKREPHTRHGLPSRQAGWIVVLLLLSGFLAACVAGSREEAAATSSNRPTATVAGGQDGPLSTVPPTFTPAPTSSLPATMPVTAKPTVTLAAEADNPVVTIPLAGPVAERRAELSGLAWYGDALIILPQFPDFNEEANGGFLYALTKAEILAFLDGQDDQPLEPRPVPFVAPGLANRIAGFEGYEAIAFSGDDVYLTIEASNNGAMLGFLVKGRMAPDLSGLTLDTSKVAAVASQTGAFNIAEESLFLADGVAGVIHELNGAEVNPAPVVHLFDRALNPVGTVAFPNAPFRITDVSALDAGGRFWAINYFYPGSDDVLDVFGTPENGVNGDQGWPAWTGLGRLLEFQFSSSGVTPTSTTPIQLEANLSDIHNWEGLVRLDERGFLLVSDEIPGSVLGFVPFPTTE